MRRPWQRRRGLAPALLLLAATAAPAAAGPCLSCSGGSGTFPMGWWHDRPLSPAGVAAWAPRVDADEWSPDVRVGVVWEDHEGGRSCIRLARSDDRGCTWTGSTISCGSNVDVLPDVAVSAGFDLALVAFVRDGAVHVARSVDGGASFATPERVHPSAGIGPWGPRLAIVPVGGVVHAHLVWTQSGRLYHAVSRDGGASWQTGPPLSDRFTGWTGWSYPDVSADTRSSAPGTESAVTITAAAPAPGRIASDIWVARSNDSGASFYGDPLDLATLDRPRRVSDPRPDDPAEQAVQPVLDASDDGSGVFSVWNVVAWHDQRAGAGPTADARCEEGFGPTLVADWNDPPASADVVYGPGGRTAALAVVPNPLDRPPTPDLHLFMEPGGTSVEISASRALLDRRALPTIVLGCGAYWLTGQFPAPRAAGRVMAESFSADEDLSHVYAVWSDDREGIPRIYFKRTDTAADPPAAVEAVPAACAAGGGIRVSWQPQGCDVDFVRVEWGTVPGVYDASSEVRGATELTLSGLMPATRYHVRVTAVDEACNEMSALEVSAVTLDCGPQPLCPNPVGNTLYAVRTAADVRLSWSPPAADPGHGAATSYDVYRSLVAPSGYSVIGNPGGPAYDDPDAVPPGSPGDLHFYRVVARNSCGTSGDEPPP